MNRKLNDTELEQFKNEVLNFKVIGLTQILNLRVKYHLTRNQTMGLIAKIVRNHITTEKTL